MSEHYDVIIAGGGYAGLCCGKTLAANGKRILILEARKEIARKHRGCQCSLYPFGEPSIADFRIRIADYKNKIRNHRRGAKSPKNI